MKWDRAKHHFESLERDIGAFLSTNRYRVVTEPTGQEGRYVVRLQYPPLLDPTTFSAVIGDCVHNLRAALDYIAWELAGPDLTDRVTMFPICYTAVGNDLAAAASRLVCRTP